MFSALAPGSYKLGIAVLQSAEVKSWTSKELFTPGERDLVLHAPGEAS